MLKEGSHKARSNKVFFWHNSRKLANSVKNTEFPYLHGRIDFAIESRNLYVLDLDKGDISDNLRKLNVLKGYFTVSTNLTNVDNFIQI